MNTCAMRSRWMIPRDIEHVIRLDEQCHNEPWSVDDYTASKSNRVHRIIENDDGQIVGVAVYVLRDRGITILRLCIDKNYRRQGLGTMLIADLKRHLKDERVYLNCRVHERQLTAQLFLKSHGFKWVQTRDDMYRMRFRKVDYDV